MAKRLSRGEFWAKTKIKGCEFGVYLKTKTNNCVYGQHYKGKITIEEMKKRYLDFYYELYLKDFEKNEFERIRELEKEGLTTSDAQAVIEAEKNKGVSK